MVPERLFRLVFAAIE
jgi:hypothetical protein